jgi:hypothetical protein
MTSRVHFVSWLFVIEFQQEYQTDFKSMSTSDTHDLYWNVSDSRAIVIDMNGKWFTSFDPIGFVVFMLSMFTVVDRTHRAFYSHRYETMYTSYLVSMLIIIDTYQYVVFMDDSHLRMLIDKQTNQLLGSLPVFAFRHKVLSTSAILNNVDSLFETTDSYSIFAIVSVVRYFLVASNQEKMNI